MKYLYGWEKSFDALNHLAGPGSLQERVSNAWLYALERLLPQHDPGDVPEEIWPRLETLNAKLFIDDDASVIAAAQVMDDDQLREVAQEIVSIAVAVIEAHGASLTQPD